MKKPAESASELYEHFVHDLVSLLTKHALLANKSVQKKASCCLLSHQILSHIKC